MDDCGGFTLLAFTVALRPGIFRGCWAGETAMVFADGLRRSSSTRVDDGDDESLDVVIVDVVVAVVVVASIM